MKKLYLSIPALILVAVSCEKEEINNSLIEKNPVPQVEMVTETVSGARGTATKATISDADASFAWTDDDDVAVHISNGKYVYTSDEGAHGATITDLVHTDDASFTVAYEAGYSRDAFAVYPSTLVAKDAANYGQEGHALDVTLPGSYKLAQVSGETSPCPMIATNEAGQGWNFFQLCGLLRMTVNDIPASTKRLEIDFGGKQVWGAFSIASPVVPGTSAIETSADEAHDVITITKDGSDVVLGETSIMLNIPLPAGEYTNLTITAYDALTDGNVLRTMTRPFNRESSSVKAFKRTATFPSAKKAFRGYEVSTGILQRTVEGSNPATYSLTGAEMVMTYDPTTGKEIYALPAGCNPFEPAVNYKKSAALNKYFHKWYTLRDELGANGNNIKTTSDKLPVGWQFPTGGGTQHEAGTDWGNVLFASPKSPITVNGTTVKASDGVYAMVQVSLESGNAYSVAGGTYYGMFLLRDGSSIPSGYLTKVGLNSKYADNLLTETQFNELIQMGCLFISASGYYDGSWRDLSTYYQCGWYWSNKYYSSSSFYFFTFDEAGRSSVASRSSNGSSRYAIVKLVKPVVD
jgi:hypothetical protein